MTAKEAAQLTGKSEGTIRRWKREGVAVENKEALLKHASTMAAKSIGATRNRALVGFSASPGSVTVTDLPPAGETGAAAALKRLQALEVQFEQRLQRALAGDDVNLVQVARADYTQVAESLRRYEREVEESKRDLGHLIPRGDAEEAVRMASVWLRLTVMSFISSHLPSLLAFSDPREAKVFFLEKFSESLQVSLMNAKDATAALPDWSEAIIRDEFRA